MSTVVPVLVEDPKDPGTYIILNMDSTPSKPIGPAPDFPTTMVWGNVGDRFFEAGVDRGVLYLEGKPGVPWVGLISVEEAPSGGEEKPFYLDGVKYLSRSSPEDFNASLEAYTFPDDFALCDGMEELANGLSLSQQRRRQFGLSYRTRIGNDVSGIDLGYKIHILYNALATPANKEYTTISDETEPSTFSWDISTRPVKFEDAAFGLKYGAHVVLDSRVIYPWALEAVEKVLYGSDHVPARLPTPQELLALFVDNALLQVVDNGDRTYTITGPDEAIIDLGNGRYEIDWESVIPLNAEEVQISSL